MRLARNHADEAHVGQHYALWMEERGLKNWRDYYKPPTGTNAAQKHRWEIPEEYHYNKWIAEESCSLLAGYKEQEENFFLWSSFFDPHPPYLVPEPWDSLYSPEAITVPQLVPGEHDRNPPHFRMTQEGKSRFLPWRESGMGNTAITLICTIGKRWLKILPSTRHGHHDGQVYWPDSGSPDRLGMTQNTLVVFTTDHGHLYGQHGMIAKGSFPL